MCEEPAPVKDENDKLERKYKEFFCYKGEPDEDWNDFSVSKQTSDILKTVSSDTFEDRAFGCILGSFVGDTTGSFLEFIECQPTKEEMIACMKQPGGGPHGVGQG